MLRQFLAMALCRLAVARVPMHGMQPYHHAQTHAFTGRPEDVVHEERAAHRGVQEVEREANEKKRQCIRTVEISQHRAANQ